MKPYDKWNSADIAQHTYRPDPQDKPVRWALVLPIVAIFSFAVTFYLIVQAVNALSPCGAC